VPEALTDDALLGGRVRFRQPRDGYRAAIDPVLLAAAVPARAGEWVLDAGAGTGAATLCLAARVPGLRIVGLEIQRELQRIASDNIRDNGLAGSADCLVGDLGRPPPRLIGASYDHVMTNPPHLEAAAASPPPHHGLARAHVEQGLDLAGWLAACLRMLRPSGRLTLIHRADRLDAILAGLAGRLGAMVVFPLWPGPEERPARRVLVAGRKGSRAPLTLARGLVLHGPDGGYSAAAEAVLRDGRALALGAEDRHG